MTTGVRVLSRLQLPPDLLARFRELDEDADGETPDVVFLHWLQSAEDTAHRAALFRYHGRSRHPLSRDGRTVALLRRAAVPCGRSGNVRPYCLSYRRSACESAGNRVPSWCPTCQVQLGEIVVPGHTDTKLELEPFLLFLAARLDELRPLLKHPVNKRVGLHEHPGVRGVTDAARTIPLANSRPRFCRSGTAADRLDVQHAERGSGIQARDPSKLTPKRLRMPVVTTLAGIYHAYHRELWPALSATGRLKW